MDSKIERDDDRPTTPPPVDRDNDKQLKFESPFVVQAPVGYSTAYHLSQGKPQDIAAYSPGGTEIVRRENEGPSHIRMKLGASTFTGAPQKKPIKEVHAINTELLSFKSRFAADSIFYRKKKIDSNHVYYAKNTLESLVDRILKIFLACENHEDYIESLNRYIRENYFHNPYELRALYLRIDQGQQVNMDSVLPKLSRPISHRDIKLTIIDHLFRLTKEADKDYDSFTEGNLGFSSRGQKTVDFARSTMKKIAEYCRTIEASEVSIFLNELNTKYIDKKKFYHPLALMALYLDDCEDYDLEKAQDGSAYRHFLMSEIEAYTSDMMRKRFSFTPLVSRVTEEIEEKEKFDEKGNMIERTRKRRVTSDFFQPSESMPHLKTDDGYASIFKLS